VREIEGRLEETEHLGFEEEIVYAVKVHVE